MSATTIWSLIGLCAVVTAAIKGAGPFALGGRDLPGWFSRVITFMAPALLAALVCTATLADGDKLAVGADTAGVAVAGVAAVARSLGDRRRRDRRGRHRAPARGLTTCAAKAAKRLSANSAWRSSQRASSSRAPRSSTPAWPSQSP